MKFFTVEWWEGEADEDPIPPYRAYLHSIRDRLPPDLIAAHETAPLHDAHLRNLELSAAERELRIELDAFEGKNTRRITLVYREVSLFRSITSPTRLGGPRGYGDFGYDEVEWIAEGQFEHRILFSSGIEMHVGFGEFRLIE